MLAVGCSEDGDTFISGGGSGNDLNNTDSLGLSSVSSNNLSPDGGGLTPNAAQASSFIVCFNCDNMLDANDDGMLDGSDPVTILRSLFLGDPAPNAPFRTCGVDDDEDLDCEQSERVNAKLILLLANHIGEASVLHEALSSARS